MTRVVIGTDMEGCAGIVSLVDQSRADGRYYEQSKRIATREFNAAVDGLLDAGVEDILMLDGHGPGAVSFNDLHQSAKLLHGRPAAPLTVRDPMLAEYDACVMIGQHAMAGLRTSNQNHTQNSRTIDYYKLNGKLIGEIAQFALYNGSLGLPMIFLSGEDLACKEAEMLIPGVTTASVKTGLGRSQAISVSATEAHRRIREGISKAIEKQRRDPIPPLVLDGPFEMEKRYHFTDEADAASNQPGAERVDDQTVRFRSDNIKDIIYR
ncbi:MAG: M55 family metallopeptidase [Candidatus Latescibacterota bacterium]|nr:M55 family metallopeptidase [Candidatus Latescibacterota bacterium]